MTTQSTTTRPAASPRAGFLVIGRKRPGFDPAWAAEMTEAASNALASLDLAWARPQVKAIDDATLRQSIDELLNAGCDTLIVLQPSMGDGRLAPLIAQKFPHPVIFWATPERPDDGKVSSCSLVGAHAFASLFRQLGHAFEVVYGHPNDRETQAELCRAVRVCSAVARLKRAKLGLVGSHAPGFINMQADPSLLCRTFGASMHHFGLDEFIGLLDTAAEAEIEADTQRIESLELPREEGLGEQELLLDSRYYLAMRALVDEENLDALALRCWPELPNRLGQWPYLAMARLAEEGYVIALEGDVDGALSCLLGQYLGAGTGYLSDWLDHDRRSITLWHPGHAPPSLCQAGTMRLGRHFNNGLPLVLNAVLEPGRPITLTRLWRCDGRYRLTACEAETAPPRRELLGASGVAVIADRDVRGWFDELCHQGMPHHLAVLGGLHAEPLRRVARACGVDWVG